MQSHLSSISRQLGLYCFYFFPRSIAGIFLPGKQVQFLSRFTMASSLSFPTMRPAGLGHGQCHSPALPPRRSTAARCAFRRDQYGGALVDEGMTVLRRRIREARMAETNYEAPAGWAAWEKRYYPAYVSDVSALAGALQLLLMSTRPSLAVAASALVLGSVPFSAVAALRHLGQAAESILHHIS